MDRIELAKTDVHYKKVKNKIKTGDTGFNIISYIVMTIMTVAVIYPLIFVLMTSLKTNADVIQNPFGMSTFTPSNYIDAWNIGHVGSYFLNSVIVTVITLFFQMIIIVLAAYAFGKLKPWGHGIIFMCYLTAMFVTSEMTTVPVFVLMKNFGLVNTRMGLILPYTATGLVMGIYILTNFIRDLPKELDEAAIIDGANIINILIKIDIPLILPALSTILIFNFQGVWSEFYWALIMIKDEAIKTLPLGLINFSSQYSSNYGVLSAGLVILTIPVLTVYLCASNAFIQGISAGAVKG